MNNYSDLLKSIKGLPQTLERLNQKAVREYTPIVNAIVQSRSQDTQHIEHTLDGLLDFCGYQPALLLYKKLCRHYFDINPASTVSYIDAYREIWEGEVENKEL